MRIRIWNAYASNNSGAYTIVGEFGSTELAEELAARLRPVLEEHTRWMDDEQRPSGESPLMRFARAEGLQPGCVTEEWPQYADSNVPRVVAVDHQLIVHHEYMASMPSFFGHWFYARGGRVQSELVHTHEPLIVDLRAYPTDYRDKAWEPVRVPRLLAALTEPGGPVATHVAEGIAPVARLIEDWSRHVLFAAVFTDPVAGCAAVRDLARAHDARLTVRIVEAVGEDPLVAYRAPGG